MSGIIARIADGDGFMGREHLRKSDPPLLGKRLRYLYHRSFKRDLDALLVVLVDQHTGWNDLVESNWTPDQPPPCLCHGTPQRSATLLFTESTLCRHQWCYRFGRTKSNYMDVLFKSAPQAEWHTLGRIYLDAPEPNWYSFEALAGLTESDELTGFTVTPEFVGDVDRQTQVLEAQAQERGEIAAISFRTPRGVDVLIHPDLNGKNWLLSTSTQWGLVCIPVKDRPEGTRLALLDDFSQNKTA